MLYRFTKHSNNFLKQARSVLLFLMLAGGLTSAIAQNQFQVRSAIDSTSVMMGAAVNYAIQVEENKGKNVVFPEGNDFSPLEVIESFKVDTLDEGGRYRLLKQYALTQFDAGEYTIPKQKITIGDKTFFTDSLKVEFRDVVIDTSNAKLYDVKGLVAVEDYTETDWLKILYWVLGALVVIGLVMFLVWKFSQKEVDPESLLSPYERSQLALQRMEADNLLQENRYKEFYSKLTDIAKKYLDEEITDHAQESTTDELIANLFVKAKMGDVSLNKEAINEFKNTLKNADFAKFAAINPSVEVARQDKHIIENFLQKVDIGKPELTEEQLMQNETYRLEQEAKLRKRRQNRMIIGGIVALVVAVLTFFAVQNLNRITGLVLGKAGNALLEEEWITSTYGVPGISVSTPGVLTRNPIELKEEQRQLLSGNQVYFYGTLETKFNVIVNTFSFRQEVDFSVEKGVETVFKQIEGRGGKNIIVKNEEFETINGTKGARVFGSFSYTLPLVNKEIKYDYVILVFAEGQGSQQVGVFYEQGDKASEKVMKRIINSVEINKSNK